MFKKMMTAAACLCVFSVSHVSAAQQTTHSNFQPHWYMGLSVLAPNENKYTRVETYTDSGSPKNRTVGHDDKTETGFALIAGFRSSPKWGTELGLYDTGAFKGTETWIDYGNIIPPSKISTVTQTNKGHNYDVAVSVLRYLNFGNLPFSAYVRAGVGYHMYSSSGSTSDFATNDPDSSKTDHAGFLYGLGVQYQASNKVDLRVDYMLFNTESIVNALHGGRFMLTLNYAL